MTHTAWRRGSALVVAALGLSIAVAACGSSTSPATGGPRSSATPPPSGSAAAVSLRGGTLTLSPAYGTDGSLVVVTIRGATPNLNGVVQLCNLGPSKAIGACDPLGVQVTTDSQGTATADYVIGEVPAATALGWAIVFKAATGQPLASAPFSPDQPTASPTPPPSPTLGACGFQYCYTYGPSPG